MTNENTQYGYAAMYQDTVWGLGRTMDEAEADAMEQDEAPASLRLRSVTREEYESIERGNVELFSRRCG